MQCVENCGPLDDPTSRVYFEQPVWQTVQMFVGELGCTSAVSSDTRIILCSNQPNVFHYILVFHVDGSPLGFIPVLYTYLRNRGNPAPLLSDDDSERDHPRPKVSGESLHGWKILLFWLPAACDLTGTTVS